MDKSMILEWIHRRFPEDSNWLTGNCYQFAILLKETFKGKIIYDPIEGHFLFLYKDNNFYDWSGIRTYEEDYKKNFINWENYKEIDSLHYSHIERDCIF